MSQPGSRAKTVGSNSSLIPSFFSQQTSCSPGWGLRPQYLLGKIQSVSPGPWTFTSRVEKTRMLKSLEDSILKKRWPLWWSRNMKMSVCLCPAYFSVVSILDVRTGVKPATSFPSGNAKFLRSSLWPAGICSTQPWGRVFDGMAPEPQQLGLGWGGLGLLVNKGEQAKLVSISRWP